MINTLQLAVDVVNNVINELASQDYTESQSFDEIVDATFSGLLSNITSYGKTAIDSLKEANKDNTKNITEFRRRITE